MRSFLIAALSSLLICSILLIYGLEWLTRRHVDPIIHYNIMAESSVFNDYRDDNEFLKNQKIFDFSRSGRKSEGEDAGPKLNPMLHWAPEYPGFNQHAIVAHDIQDHILRIGRNWNLHTSTFRVFFDRDRVDLKIFNDIAKYSYWDVEKNSPISVLIKENVALSPDTIPRINSLDIIALCKLRLISAIFKEDYLQALKDVRKFSELLLTTENYSLELTALSIFEAEHTAYVLFSENGWLKPTDWTPIDSNTTRRASRAIKATKSLLRFWTPSPILKQIFLSGQNPIGFCAAAGEALPQEFALEPKMTSHFIFERDYSQNYQLLEEIWARVKENCHQDYLAHSKPEDNYVINGFTGGFLGYLPYSRKLFGLSQSADRFEGFREYSSVTN